MKETKFIKSYNKFVKENLDNDIEDEIGGIEEIGEPMDFGSSELPKDVSDSVESILKMNFDYVDKPKINGEEITFGVSEADGRLDPEEVLSLDLGFGAMKKRKFLVTLNFINKEIIEDGYQLTYSIQYEPNNMPDVKPKKVKEIEYDDDLTPEEIELKNIEREERKWRKNNPED